MVFRQVEFLKQAQLVLKGAELEEDQMEVHGTRGHLGMFHQQTQVILIHITSGDTICFNMIKDNYIKT
jgi:hypothetical protein